MEFLRCCMSCCSGCFCPVKGQPTEVDLNVHVGKRHVDLQFTSETGGYQPPPWGSL
ncbi:Cys-pro leader peptide [Thetapolyomavirus trepennellii]|uniref:Cys-pro leader peptide n=1 Tax=Thetapolyomavirus trepennellii TaxID=2170103 RepID=A0A0E3GJ24_9POLY|nr:Cys-pro leader peptide [Thetapolyomavirus trepennellii]AJZ72669.1 Cys-pro leader peptide [Thetapolyomavirus trepennellii]